MGGKDFFSAPRGVWKAAGGTMIRERCQAYVRFFILTSALFAGRRILGFVDSGGGAGSLHRSFVGSLPLRGRLRCLRMTGV